jgi:hypothetical protein
MEEVDKEISEMKLSLNARARTVAESYLLAVSDSVQSSIPFSDIPIAVSVVILVTWSHDLQTSGKALDI